MNLVQTPQEEKKAHARVGWRLHMTVSKSDTYEQHVIFVDVTHRRPDYSFVEAHQGRHPSRLQLERPALSQCCEHVAFTLPDMPEAAVDGGWSWV